jgi:hypothetical protein
MCVIFSVAPFRRYFAMEESEAEPQNDAPSGNQFTEDTARKLLESTSLTTVERGGGDESPLHSKTSQDVISSARRLIAEKQFVLASTMLEKAVETHKDSEDVWILYLQLKSQMTLSADLPELYKLFHTAVSSCQSYALIWEVSPVGGKSCMWEVSAVGGVSSEWFSASWGKVTLT